MRRMPKTLKSRMTKPVTCISPDASRVYHWPVKLEKVPMSAKRVPNSKYSLNFHQLSFIIYLRSIYIQCKRLISKKCSEFLWRASLLIVCIIRWVMTVVNTWVARSSTISAYIGSIAMNLVNRTLKVIVLSTVYVGLSSK